MTIADWCTAVHLLAKDKGWYDQPRSPLEHHMLVVSEMAEATEAVRTGMPELYRLHPAEPQPEQLLLLPSKGAFHEMKHLKPEGEAVELADAVLRIMDYFESKGWDLEQVMRIKHAYNRTRSHKHGGKTI